MIPLIKREPNVAPLLPSQPASANDGALNTTKVEPSSGTSHASTLEITQQPPETWYKDQNGRKGTFELRVRRSLAQCTSCADQRHLTVQLLYENGKLVENQSIVRVASGLCLNKENESDLAIRIMEVSKNHQNQRFRIQITPPPCANATIISAVTNAVLVLSKKNKRSVKQDAPEHNPQIKKPKFVEVPSQTTADESVAPAPSPKAKNALLPKISTASDRETNWDTQTVRFKTPNASVCMWANAAYNFLQKLQWQRVSGDDTGSGDEDLDEMLTSASAKPYQCPVCHESFGSTPMHQADCDLGLLLQLSQADEDTPSAVTAAIASPINHVDNNYWTPVKNKTLEPIELFGVKSANPLPPMHNLPPALAKFTEQESHDARPGAFGPLSVELLTKNLKLDSWESYSTLSRAMFSLDANENGGTNDAIQFQATPRGSGSDTPTIGSFSSFLPGLSNLASTFQDTQTPKSSSTHFSKIISSMKNLPPDAAEFLHEQDAQLAGEATLLFSFSKVSMTDLLNNESPTARDQTNIQSLSSLLMEEAKVNINEADVFTIVATDFRHCGFPAFSKTSSLLGFYFFSRPMGESSDELRFLPNFYPLPAEMLQSLEHSFKDWKRDGRLVFTREGPGDKTLADLKQRVVKMASTS